MLKILLTLWIWVSHPLLLAGEVVVLVLPLLVGSGL
jgi:hypothetical protein